MTGAVRGSRQLRVAVSGHWTPPARHGRVELGGRYGGTVKRTGAGCGQSRLKAETGVPLVQEFNAATLRFLREAVMAHASAAGLPPERAIDVMLAVHEL